MASGDAQRSLLMGWVGRGVISEGFLEEVVVAGF